MGVGKRSRDQSREGRVVCEKAGLPLKDEESCKQGTCEVKL